MISKKFIKKGMLVVAALTIIMLVIGCKTTSNDTPISTLSTKSASLLSPASFVSKSLGVSIKYPKGWTIDESGKFGAKLFFFNNSIDKSGNLPFASNINITTEDAHGYGLKAYVDASKKYIVKIYPSYQSIPDIKVKINNIEAYVISGTFSQKGYFIKNVQLILINSGKAYIVTATALASKWTKYSDLFNAVFNTFKVVK